MKHRQRSMRARRRRPALSYTEQWLRDAARAEWFRRQLPRIAAAVMRHGARRRANRARKGRPDPIALDRKATPFLAFLARKSL